MTKAVRAKRVVAAAEGQRANSKTRIQALNRGKAIEAATAVFAQHGYRGSTVDKIAQQAGMSKPNLLYYFKTKHDLYLAVLDRIMGLWLAPLEDLQEDQDPVAELSAYIDAKFKFSRAQPQASKVWANEIISGAALVRPMLETGLRDIVERKSSVLKAWQKRGLLAGAIHPEHLIFMIWAITQTYADFASQIAAVTGKGIADKQFYAQAVANAKQVLLYGILPR
jgi:TetR/AcrR family transcriptional regulator